MDSGRVKAWMGAVGPVGPVGAFTAQ